ncbi:MAG TPA: hypothetical protein VNX27_04075 [Chthoniobacterales bacterium]|jgi:hypothetical protein|nr:hypothetical protein [Chthoniobacterales bacterium]
MKSPTRYSFLIAAASLFASSQLQASPVGFSELSLLVRMHEPEFSIKNEVAERKLLHPLTQPQENLLKSQGASDALIKSLRDSNLVASKEEVAAAEAATTRQVNASSNEPMSHSGHHRHVLVFDVSFGRPINLSQWGGLDYEIAFYSYRFAGEDHIQPALIDQVGTRTVVYRSIPLESENEVFNEDWFPTNGVRNWRYTPYNGAGGTLLNGRGDFRDTRSINFSDSVAVGSYSVSRPVAIDWDDPVFLDGQPYTFYPVYSAGGVSLYYINANSNSARVAVAFNR